MILDKKPYVIAKMALRLSMMIAINSIATVVLLIFIMSRI